MIQIDLKTLCQVLGVRCPAGCEGLRTAGVSIDSRTVGRGQVFFAIKGERFDGGDFVKEAFEKGAVCAVAENDIPAAGGPIVRVDDTVVALGILAAWYRKQLSCRVVAITGSVGKTTTRSILYQILNRRFRCRQAVKSFNNQIGVPLTILSARQDDQVLLLELGTNHPGEIGYLTRIARPDIALVTFVGPAHLEGFGSVERIIVEKLSIADGLADGGVLIVNGDQPEVVEHLKRDNRRFVSFGLAAGCDVRAEEMSPSADGGYMTLAGRRIFVPLAGGAGLCNALAAGAVCRQLGISQDEFEKGCAGLEPVSMRCVVRRLGGCILIDDCYNANPVSMENALECLRLLGQKHPGRRVFVAGTMAELGAEAKRMHFELGEKACRAGVGLLLAAGAFASDIVGGAIVAGLEETNCKTFADTDLLCDNLHRFPLPDDIILVKGSRVAGLEKAVRVLEELFRQIGRNEAKT